LGQNFAGLMHLLMFKHWQKLATGSGSSRSNKPKVTARDVGNGKASKSDGLML